MKFLIYIMAILLVTSCSTMKRSQLLGGISGGLICGVLGSSLGKELSPDQESVSFNKTLGFTTGAVTCGTIGYYLGGKMYKSDPRNYEDRPLKFEEKRPGTPKQEALPEPAQGINLSDLRYEVDETASLPLVKSLPEDLKSKVKRQELIKYKIQPQTVKTKDGRLLHFGGGEAIEHRYIDTKGE